jgi:hypothetical protein
MYTKHEEKVPGTRSFTGDAVLFVGAAMKEKGEGCCRVNVEGASSPGRLQGSP